jgi:hypothetical protein
VPTEGDDNDPDLRRDEGQRGNRSNASKHVIEHDQEGSWETRR